MFHQIMSFSAQARIHMLKAIQDAPCEGGVDGLEDTE